MKRKHGKQRARTARIKQRRRKTSISQSSLPRFEQLEDRLMLSLLGVGTEIGLPDVDYDSNGAMIYDSVNDTFDSDATPTGITLAAGARPVRITSPSDFQLHIQVDANGDLIGGVAGDDLLIEGVIDVNRDRVPEYSGTLLTGEIVAFGFLDTGSTQDQYDFRFTPTGGALMPFFEGKDIGLVMTSLVSNFEGDFSVNFTGGSQGVLGPIDPLVQVPDSTLAGRVFVDANNNGVDDGEVGIEDAVVTLTGTDVDGNAVNMATVTLANGSYLFEGLAPGTYTVTEAPQPEGLLDGSDAAGSLGGVVGNDVISGIVITGDDAATGYNFGELQAASLAGNVVLDANNNGIADSGEAGIADVTVALGGTDDLGVAVSATTATLADGSYIFDGLRPGTYSVTETTQPIDYLDGADSAGAIGGIVGNDVITAIALASGDAAAGYTFGELQAASLGGNVFLDANNNGIMDIEDEALADVTITLSGTDDLGNLVNISVQTDINGEYLFEGLRPGTYSIQESQPEDLLDGDKAAGSLGGVVNVDGDMVENIVVSSGDAGSGYAFAELEPASISGMVYVDFNNDGEADFSEGVIEGVTINLEGIDDRGNAVNLSVATDVEGDYAFVDLRPGTYTINEVQPAGYADGQDVVGTAGGVLANDQVSGIQLSVAAAGMNYDFAERPEAGSAVTCGQTASIGFWRSRKGQRLIKSLNGDINSTQLANWLAATFPNMYGSEAGDNDLTGMTNYEVGQFYRKLFRAKKCGRWWKRRFRRQTKLDAQVMGLAFATYVTNESLAGQTAASYGFSVTEYGTGISTFSVGCAGEAFGVADDTEMAVIDMLQATNEQAVDGDLYDGSHALRSMANAVYTAINEAGNINLCGNDFINWFRCRVAALFSCFYNG